MVSELSETHLLWFVLFLNKMLFVSLFFFLPLLYLNSVFSQSCTL